MTKKAISIVLVIITLLSTFSITASAASYSTGTYSISTTKGLNVRRGAGTYYSKVGTATYNTKFYVSKISGNWGYTSSIRCTNGTRAGWVSLDYCRRSSSGSYNRNSYNDVFASVKGSGYSFEQGKASQSTTFTKGTFVYVWAYVHDGNGNFYKSYGSGSCNMTLSIYRPDGSCASRYTYYNSDNNWIGCELDRAGTWKIRSQITGSISGDNVQLITVKENSSSYYTLSYDANGGYGAPSAQIVKKNTGFNLRTSKPSRTGYKFLGWSTNKNATYASYSPNQCVKIDGNITLYAIWQRYGIEITGDLSYTFPKVGDTYYLKAKAYPSNTTRFTWYTSNPRVVSISSSGKMVAKSAGTATITARTSDGRSQSVKITVSNGNKWRTGKFDTGYVAKGYTTVHLNKSAGDGYIRIYTYDNLGFKTSGEIHVTLRDWSGKWICEFDTKSGARLKLGDDHSQYRVYIAKKKYSNDISGQSRNWNNIGKCVSWAVECTDKCYI